MKRKSERRPTWAAAPPCSRRCSSTSPSVKKSRSSTSQDLHRLDLQDDLYLDITGEPVRERVAGPRCFPALPRRLRGRLHRALSEPRPPHPLRVQSPGSAPPPRVSSCVCRGL
ncbi:hypothetical protein GHT09_010558 [Marmota monax]|uniref:Uncharacterized protein n=1 Tax=Marmota monax TaxID=9995 RepID=A0A834QHA1_MARMO|nr:hypothetical protein GHT09_010558 [Marmota monax]